MLVHVTYCDVTGYLKNKLSTNYITYTKRAKCANYTIVCNIIFVGAFCNCRQTLNAKWRLPVYIRYSEYNDTPLRPKGSVGSRAICNNAKDSTIKWCISVLHFCCTLLYVIVSTKTSGQIWQSKHLCYFPQGKVRESCPRWLYLPFCACERKRRASEKCSFRKDSLMGESESYGHRASVTVKASCMHTDLNTIFHKFQYGWFRLVLVYPVFHHHHPRVTDACT